MRNIFSYILKRIEKEDLIVIFNHANCDGDCYGSQVGLKEIILSTYPDKKVFVVGSGFSRLFNLLGKPDIVSDEVIKRSLLVLVDFNELGRSEDDRIFLNDNYVCFDHHNKDRLFIDRDTFHVDTTKTSAASIVYEFYKQMNLKISKLGINALFAGIVSDTNRFLYLENDAASLAYGHELILLGAEFKKVYECFSSSSEDALLLKKYIYENVTKTQEGVIYAVIKREFLNKIGYSSYAGSMVNILSNIDGLPIWALFVENEEGKMSVELRSNKYKVLDVAIKYGGGGHYLASGISKSFFKEEIINSIINDLNEIIRKDKGNV